jgi:hypothetical protein
VNTRHASLSRSPAAPRSLAERLAGRIARATRKQPDRVFTPADFLDLGTPHAVGMALSRMVRAGTLRRVGRGLYDVPRTHPLLGNLAPSVEQAVQAIARRSGVEMRPLDVSATNLLGLSEQVVARPVYETNGPSRTIRVGNTDVEFKHRSPRRVTAAAPSAPWCSQRCAAWARTTSRAAAWPTCAACCRRGRRRGC